MENSPQELLFEVAEGVGIMTLNRPDKRNALTTSLLEEMRRILGEVKKRDEIKVLVVTGNGTAFSSGADIETRMLPRLVDGHYVPLEKTRADLLEPAMLYTAPAFYNLGKPSIAAVNGIAAGAGLSLALLCDFRIASDKARFIASWLNVGLTPDVGATFFLPRLIGVDKTLKLLYTREPMDASKAEQIGLVTEVVPHDSLMKAVKEFAARIATGPSVAMELARQAVYRGLLSDLTSQLYFENYAQNMCFMSEDFKEGVKAFLEKRQPNFKGK